MPRWLSVISEKFHWNRKWPSRQLTRSNLFNPVAFTSGIFLTRRSFYITMRKITYNICHMYIYIPTYICTLLQSYLVYRKICVRHIITRFKHHGIYCPIYMYVVLQIRLSNFFNPWWIKAHILVHNYVKLITLFFIVFYIINYKRN